MGLRFRKSVKIAPGIKLNFNKKSMGLTFGGKGVHYTINSSGRRTASVGIPGTGISYTSSAGGSQKKAKSSTDAKSSASGGGCLVTCLKFIGIFMLFSILLAFGWIAGIIWLIFFRKKLADNPQKQQKYTIGISIASVVSFIFFIYTVFFAPPTPTTLTLIPTTDKTELEINADYVINLQYEPEDATLSNVRFKVDKKFLATIIPASDNASLTLHTDKEGTINVTAYINDVESNTLTFEIIDTERIAEEKATMETVEQLAKEEALKETELQELDEENSQRTSEESTVLDNSETSTTEKDNAVMVWIDDSAAKYHKKDGCGMSNAYQVTLDEAIAMGKGPCGRCY